MKKEFKYVVDSKEDLPKKMQEFSNEVREIFKEPLFKLKYESFTNASKCYNPSFSIKQSNECTEKSLKKINDYYNKVEVVFKKWEDKLNLCANKCDPNNKECLSACFNNMANEIYPEILNIHLTLN